MDNFCAALEAHIAAGAPINPPRSFDAVRTEESAGACMIDIEDGRPTWRPADTVVRMRELVGGDYTSITNPRS